MISRKTIILAALLLAAACGARNHRFYRGLQERIEATAAEARASRAAAAALREEIAATQKKVEAENAGRRQAEAAAAEERRKLAQVDPESLWAAPPARLPDWNPDSPYVWLSKELLPRLPIAPFDNEGQLDGNLAALLAIEPGQQRALNEKMRALFENFLALEAQRARQTTNHLSGIENGERITIEVPPLSEGESAALQKEFKSAIAEGLGAQRAEIIFELGRGWIGEQLDDFGRETKTISAVRHPDGTYNVNVKTPGNWKSVGGGTRLEDEIPPHLLPAFDSLRPVPESSP